MLLPSWRLPETISESGCWRSPVSVPQRGLWAAGSQGGPRGLSRQPAVSSGAGWGRRAEWPIGGWSVGSHNQAPELAVVQLAADAACVPSSSWGHCCAHGAGMCARVPALWQGCAGAPGSSWSKRQQLNFCQCACVWCPQHPPLIHPSEARLGLCWVLGTCDGWMWSPLSRSPCFVWEAVCAGHWGQGIGPSLGRKCGVERAWWLNYVGPRAALRRSCKFEGCALAVPHSGVGVFEEAMQHSGTKDKLYFRPFKRLRDVLDAPGHPLVSC